MVKFNPKRGAYSLSEALIALSLMGILALIAISVLHGTDGNILAATAKLNKVDAAMKTFDMALKKSNETGLGIQSQITNQNTLSTQVKDNFLHNSSLENITVDINEEEFQQGAKLELSNGTDLYYAYDSEHIPMAHNGVTKERLGAMYATVEYKGETYGREYTIFNDGIVAGDNVEIQCQAPRQKDASGKTCVCINGGEYDTDRNTCICKGDDVEQNGICAPCPANEIKSDNSCICDAAKRYYGEHNSCQQCRAPRVISGNQCVCDAAAHLVEDANGACVCDTSNHYFGTPNNCQQCSAPKSITNNGQSCKCVAADINDYADNEIFDANDNTCKATCQGNQVANETHTACECRAYRTRVENARDINDHTACYCQADKPVATGGICQPCGTNKIWNKTANGGQGACVCDGEKGFVPDGDGCKQCNEDEGWVINDEKNACVCDESKNLIQNGDKCVCNASISYYGNYTINTPCEYCDKAAGFTLNDKYECVCDSTLGYVPDGNGSCKICDEANGWIMNAAKDACVCDTSKNLTLNGGKCVCDRANKYYGDINSCKLCEAPKTITDEGQCLCVQSSLSLADNEIFDAYSNTCKAACPGQQVANSAHNSCECRTYRTRVENDTKVDDPTACYCPADKPVASDGTCQPCGANEIWNKTANDGKGACVEQPKELNDCDKKYGIDGYIPISTAEELALVASGKTVNGIKYANNATYCQTADIDLAANNFDTDDNPDNGNWKPLPSFSGIYDGNEKKISNMKINLPNNTSVGLFSRNEGLIKSIGIEKADVTAREYVGGLVGNITGNAVVDNCYSTGKIYANDEFVGGLVGYSYQATIQNSYSDANVNCDGSGGYVGGLLGRNYKNGLVINSHATGTVKGSGPYVGGLVGRSGAETGYKSSVKNSYATGNVYGKNYVGGLCGEMGNIGGLGQIQPQDYILSNSYATGDVIGSDGYVGGLVGRTDSVSITDSYSTGEITGKGYVGGIAGRMEKGTINKVYSTGVINASDSYVGGIAGYTNNTPITNSYSTGAVTGAQYVGGIAGKMEKGTIDNTHSLGKIEGSGGYVAGIVGDAKNVPITNSYSTGEITGKGYVGGIAGRMEKGTINKVYSTGVINASDSYVGGLVGYFTHNDNLNMEKSYVTGNIFNKKDDEKNAYTGGFFGYISINGNIFFDDCYVINQIESSGDKVGGVFGYVTVNGAISANNMTISGSVKGKSLVGAFTGQLGRIKYMHNIITNTDVSGESFIGGVIGILQNGNIILDAITSTGRVTASVSTAGGIIGGINYAGRYSLMHASALGNISASADSTGNAYVGGLIGLSSMQLGRTTNIILDSFATGNISSAGAYTGGLAGSVNSDITNSYATGNVTSTGTDSRGYSYAGGLAGSCSNISNSYAGGTVNATGAYAGGLAGYGSNISNSYAGGNVASTGTDNKYGKAYVGGLTGSSTTITNSYATGTVNATGPYVGGLAGSSTTITNSYAGGNVTSTGTDKYGNSYAGGLTGYGSNISNSYATGTVNATGAYVGGLAGYAQNVSDSYATGTVKATGTDKYGNSYAGGLTGYGSNISNSYATGTVNATGKYIGAIAGYSGKTENSFYNKDTALQEYAAGNRSKEVGNALTTEELKSSQIFISAGWSSDNWCFSDNNYQYLLNMPSGAPDVSSCSVGEKEITADIVDNPAKKTCEDIDNPALIFISTPEELALVGSDKTVNGVKYDGNGSYCQIADIDLSGFDTDDDPSNGNWKPLPSVMKYDGNNFEIKNVKIALPTKAGGFFYSAQHVSNLKLVDLDIVGSSVGGLVSGGNVIIDNCHISGKLECTSYYCGGLVGNISNDNSSFFNSSFEGTIFGNSEVGGIIGNSSNSHTYIQNCYMKGNIVATGNMVGGLIGNTSNDDTIFVNSFVEADIISNGDRVAGIRGGDPIDYSFIKNTYFKGTVTGKSNVGGILSTSSTWSSPAYMRNVYVDGVITGESNVAGIKVASLPIRDSYSAATVISEKGNQCAISAKSGSDVNKVFYNSDLAECGTPDKEDPTTPITTAQMQTPQTFIDAGWDTTIWELVQGQYPKLKNVGGQ